MVEGPFWNIKKENPFSYLSMYTNEKSLTQCDVLMKKLKRQNSKISYQSLSASMYLINNKTNSISLLCNDIKAYSKQIKESIHRFFSCEEVPTA